MSATIDRCPTCAAPLPRGVLAGLCASCLLAPAVSWWETQHPTESTPETHPPLAEGTVIGPYTLRERLGEGGFAEVYAADQSQPVRRRVAIKLLKPGMDSREILARFEAERQALASLEHPGIVHVFDAGAMGQGRPYFVMELVEGLPLTEYCSLVGLTLHQRVILLAEICRAVQHAHHKGLIHRDLKPSNVLVTEIDGRPMPKIIDFGIAKALEREFSGATAVTVFRRLLGTPQYMAPEQAEGAGCDTRSDVHSLGVILYELLAGNPPLTAARLRAVGQAEVLRLIREEEPHPPSQRGRRSPPGDLDWIALKALAKEPERRYASASALAEDLEHFLRDEPVSARPPTLSYQARKFARRHRLSLSVAGGFLVLIVAGAAVSVWQAMRATSARHAAEQSEKRMRGALKDAYATRERLRRENYRASIRLAESRLGGLLAHTVPSILWQTERGMRNWEWGYLMAQCAQDEWVLPTGQGRIVALQAFSSGALLAIAAEDRNVCVWDVSTREKRWAYRAGGDIWSMAVDPGGQFVAFTTNVEGGRLTVLDATTGKPLFHSSDTGWNQMNWSMDGESIFAANARELVKITVSGWKIVCRRAVTVAPAVERPLIVDQAGQFVVLSSDWGGNYQLYRAADLTPAAKLPQPVIAQRASGCAVDSARGLFVTAYIDTVYFTSPDSEAMPTSSYVHEGSSINILKLVPQTGLVVASSSDSVLIIGPEGLRDERRIDGDVGALATADDGVLFVATVDGVVHRWESMRPRISAGMEEWTDRIGSRFLAFSSDPPGIFCLRPSALRGRWLPMPSGDRPPRNQTVEHWYHQKVAYRNKQGLPATDPWSGRVMLAGERDLRFIGSKDGSNLEVTETVPTRASPWAATGDPLGRWIIYSCTEGIFMRERASGTEYRIDFFSPTPAALSIARDGSVAMATSQQGLQVWDTGTRRVIFQKAKDNRPATLHPSGKVCAFTQPGSVVVWDLEGGRKLAELPAGGRPQAVHFSPDGHRLLMGGPDDRISWWDWRLGETLLTLRERAKVWDTILSPDGTTLANAGSNLTVKLRYALPWWLERGAPEFQAAWHRLPK